MSRLNHVEVLSETIINLSEEIIQKEVDQLIEGYREKFEAILLKERVRLMNQIEYHLKRDVMADRIVFTLEFKDKKIEGAI